MFDSFGRPPGEETFDLIKTWGNPCWFTAIVHGSTWCQTFSKNLPVHCDASLHEFKKYFSGVGTLNEHMEIRNWSQGIRSRRRSHIWNSSFWEYPSTDKTVSGARFSKVPRTFRVRKAIPKTPTSLFCKAVFFFICCKGNKNKDNCKVSCLETPSFWRYKEYYVTRNAPEKFRYFRGTGPSS